jgi:hypothetical protein
MSLYVIIPGYGSPNASVKEQIFHHNIDRIMSTGSWNKVSVHLCIYDDTPSPMCDHPHVDFHVHREPGLPATFLKKFATPEHVATYEYVLIVLDDILLLPSVDFTQMIEYKRTFNLNIISPTLSLDSKFVYNYMLTDPQRSYIVKITTCCELFCFLVDTASFLRYYTHIDPDNNPWLWGLDLILHKHMHMNVGMTNGMHMKHFFHSTSYSQHANINPHKGLVELLAQFGETEKTAADQKAVRYLIMEPSYIEASDATHSL